MRSLSRIGFTLLIVCSAYLGFAQDTLRLSHEEFLAIVKNYHPLALRYRLQNQIAQSEIQRARGNFDPFVDAKKGAKTIDGVNYYDETNVGLGIPTWYGVELNGSYNTIDGQRLNNSETRGGLYQLGITLPLAKDLIYDKRRALLDQAKAALRMTEAEQQLLTNQLLLDADNTYWDWVRSYENYQLQRRNVMINEQRLDLTRKTYNYGERAAIDTTEALSQLQNFQLQMEDAYLKFLKATQELSLYLWKSDQQPYELVQQFFPSDALSNAQAYDAFTTLLMAIGNEAIQDHAALRYYLFKNNILESERRLKRQNFLPKLDFTYNFLNKENYRSEYYPFFQNNYQYGFKFGVPLFLRPERAEYRMAKAKIFQNQLDIDYKRLELSAKIRIYSNEVLNYNNQIDIAEANIENYRRLMEAEETKFSNGESSLFLINSRENKLLEAEQKLLDIRLKFINSYNQLKWLKENFEN